MREKADYRHIDSALMFKIRIIQALSNLPDGQMEYLIKDRLSFMRFLRLGLADRLPDAKLVWLFCERQKQAGTIGKTI